MGYPRENYSLQGAHGTPASINFAGEVVCHIAVIGSPRLCLETKHTQPLCITQQFF